MATNQNERLAALLSEITPSALDIEAEHEEIRKQLIKPIRAPGYRFVTQGSLYACRNCVHFVSPNSDEEEGLCLKHDHIVRAGAVCNWRKRRRG